MTRAEDELDEFGKRMLAPLRSAPPLDSQAITDVKAKYLLEGENLRQLISSQPVGEEPKQRKNTIFGTLQHKPVMKALVAVLLAFVVILVGSSFTVFASQSSLPGEALYQVKSWSEDVRLSLISSPDARLGLTLYFINRRMDEISSLMAGGYNVDEQTTDRFRRELEDALQLAAQLDDTQMQHALGEIKSQAEKQRMTMAELINKLPPQAEPAVLKLQERLNEQVMLSSVGEKDPKEFRVQVHERREKQQKHSTEPGQSQSTPDETVTTPLPSEDANNHGNKLNRPTEEPGQGGSGNGNHGLNPTHTPKP